MSGGGRTRAMRVREVLVCGVVLMLVDLTCRLMFGHFLILGPIVAVVRRFVSGH
jgi:hypothetical protein